MKAQILAVAAGIAVFAGFSPYIPGDVLRGNWENTRGHNLADVSAAHLQAGVRSGIGFFTTSARADEADSDSSPIDFSKLVKIDEKSYEISHDSTVSLIPSHSEVIRKIGYGRQSEVRIVSTGSGTYSTDGFVSNHVQYVGIDATRISDADRPAQILLWLGGRGWVDLGTGGGGSFVHFGRMQGGGGYLTGKNRSCFYGKGFFGCS